MQNFLLKENIWVQIFFINSCHDLRWTLKFVCNRLSHTVQFLYIQIFPALWLHRYIFSIAWREWGLLWLREEAYRSTWWLKSKVQDCQHWLPSLQRHSWLVAGLLPSFQEWFLDSGHQLVAAADIPIPLVVDVVWTELHEQWSPEPLRRFLASPSEVLRRVRAHSMMLVAGRILESDL